MDLQDLEIIAREEIASGRPATNPSQKFRETFTPEAVLRLVGEAQLALLAAE